MNLEQLLKMDEVNEAENELEQSQQVAMEAYANIESLIQVKNVVSTEGMSSYIAEQLNQADSTILDKPSNYFTSNPSKTFANVALEGIGSSIIKWVSKFIDAFCDYAERFWSWLKTLAGFKKEFTLEIKRQNDFNKKVVNDITKRKSNVEKKISNGEDESGELAAQFHKIVNDQLPDLKDLKEGLDNSITKLLWSFTTDNAAHMTLQTYSMYIQSCDKSMGRSLTSIDELVKDFEKGNLLNFNMTNVELIRERVMNNYADFSRWQQTISKLNIAGVTIPNEKGAVGQALGNFYTRLFDGIKQLDSEPASVTYVEALKRNTFKRDLEDIERVTSKTYDSILLKENYSQIAKNIKNIRELKNILINNGMITDSTTPESVLMSVLGGLQKAMINSGKMRNLYRIYPKTILRFKMAENRYLQAKQKHYARI